MSRNRKQGSAPAANMQAAPMPIAQPTDAYIPPYLATQVPELESFKELLEAERKIDIYINRKKIDLYQSVSQWNTLKQESQEKQYLRIFISNIAENQAWQTQEAGVEPSWTLRVEGRLLNSQDVADPQRPKFSTFLQGIAVDFTEPQDTTVGGAAASENGQSSAPQEPHQPGQPQHSQQPQAPQQNQPPSIVEWHFDPANPADFDGLDIKRDGSHNIECKIVIQPRGTTGEWIQFSPELASIIGISRGTLHEAIYSLYKYILLNDLLSSGESEVASNGQQAQGQSNNTNGERTIVKTDKYLAVLFPEERSFFKLGEIPALINRHVSPLPPIKIDYTVRVDKASTYGETVLDVEVPAKVNDEVAQQGMSLLSELNQLSTTLEPQMQQLNQEINILQLQLNSSANKYQFFQKLANDPVPMLEEYIQSSSRALKILSGDDGFNEDTVRRASFYKENEGMLFENLGVLLSNGRI
ncbi:LADA_0E13872g1_1 [Lachancea dasiensis]|uniref:LADA_0E13872g1_1 n=1 Tax=Lachancea dasiensis TaxID=1072105 RepID=A0A1G4JFR6_9SACH|nr:LADA_0E13872g1_1 [Lachancea dasiensis]